MKQFEQTTLFKLELLDRFYFASDKKKVVWEYSNFECNHSGKVTEVTIESIKGQRTIKSDKKVIFLRNPNN